MLLNEGNGQGPVAEVWPFDRTLQRRREVTFTRIVGGGF